MLLENGRDIRHAMQLDVQGIAAEDGMDTPGTEDAAGDALYDDLFDGSTTGDAGHEQARERSVGQPVGPVEHGPVLGEGAVRVRVRPGRHPDDVLEHVADAIDEVIDKERSWSNAEDESYKRNRKIDIEF